MLLPWKHYGDQTYVTKADLRCFVLEGEERYACTLNVCVSHFWTRRRLERKRRQQKAKRRQLYTRIKDKDYLKKTHITGENVGGLLK